LERDFGGATRASLRFPRYQQEKGDEGKKKVEKEKKSLIDITGGLNATFFDEKWKREREKRKSRNVGPDVKHGRRSVICPF